jgi:hypothetical protein
MVAMGAHALGLSSEPPNKPPRDVQKRFEGARMLLSENQSMKLRCAGTEMQRLAKLKSRLSQERPADH